MTEARAEGRAAVTENVGLRDVRFALGKLAERLSTRSVRLARMILIQATRNAMANDLVVRNVADLAAVPTGKAGLGRDFEHPEGCQLGCQALYRWDRNAYEQRK